MRMKQVMALGMTTMMLAYPPLTVNAQEPPQQQPNSGFMQMMQEAMSRVQQATGNMQQSGAPGGMSSQQGQAGQSGQMPGSINGGIGQSWQMPGQMNGQISQTGQVPGGMNQNVTYASEASEIVTSNVTNTAASLTADTANATSYVMSDSDNQVTIDEAGTYIISGSCADGNITVKKGTTGVVLILKDLDLTSTTGATLSLNKNSEAKVIVDGNVSLTDAENLENAYSSDTTVADAYDGAVIKAKDGSNVYLTGTGTLTLNGNAKNGIKIGDADDPSFVIDGDLTLDITAANDGINAGYDLSILSGNLNINAGDDAIHADRILTIGSENGTGPSINIMNSVEGLEGTVVNLFGGSGKINATDDAVNAANSDGTYANELAYSINVTGGDWNINCTGDGLDSNGNINLTGGFTDIRSGTVAGEAGIDYTGNLYVADGTLSNMNGIAGPDMMPGEMNGQMPGEMNGQMPGEMNGQQMPGQTGQFPGEMNSQQAPWQQDGNQTGTQQPPEMQNGQFGTQQPPQMPGGQMPGEMKGQRPGR